MSDQPTVVFFPEGAYGPTNNCIGIGAELLGTGKIDAFATNKAVLFELADALPSHRVLDLAWGHEALAVAIPQGRQAAMPWLTSWTQQFQAQGQLDAIASRSGLRGLAPKS